MRIGSTFLTTIALTLCAGSALAVPTIALQPQPTPVVTRVASDEKTTYGCPDRYSQTNSCIVDGNSQGVGYHDCVADTELEFGIAMTGVPDANYNLQIWAGTGDCTQVGATNNATTGICWQVAASPQMAVVISPFYIRVADLVRYINVNPPPQSYTRQDALTACNDARTQTSSSTTVVADDAGNTTATAGVATVTIYFLVFQNGAGGTAPVASATYPVKVKLAGPNPPTNVAAGGGNGELVITWTPPAGDTTVQGFELFAAPEGSTTSISDASTTTCNDASTELLDDAGNPVLDDAGNPIFVPGDGGCTSTGPTVNSCGGTPSIDVSGITCSVNGDAGSTVSANGGVCEVVGGITTNSHAITGLTNNTQYTAAVAAFDQYGNTGVVATASKCSTPKPIDDFWTDYNKAGGNAFCALAFVGSRGGAVAAALVGIIGMIFVRRRRKR